MEERAPPALPCFVRHSASATRGIYLLLAMKYQFLKQRFHGKYKQFFGPHPYTLPRTDVTLT